MLITKIIKNAKRIKTHLGEEFEKEEKKSKKLADG